MRLSDHVVVCSSQQTGGSGGCEQALGVCRIRDVNRPTVSQDDVTVSDDTPALYVGGTDVKGEIRSAVVPDRISLLGAAFIPLFLHSFCRGGPRLVGRGLYSRFQTHPFKQLLESIVYNFSSTRAHGLELYYYLALILPQQQVRRRSPHLANGSIDWSPSPSIVVSNGVGVSKAEDSLPDVAFFTLIDGYEFSTNRQETTRLNDLRKSDDAGECGFGIVIYRSLLRRHRRSAVADGRKWTS
ncbi:unnamed protein product [Soboliphyme baturini]|uniref:Uncharacterized protein n=1 Tax=Soboliphyme baturini TaxID=241478 RepID=A0A183IS09_9BILA|nr:unnamed protein product [Soboliphyme baturini]